MGAKVDSPDREWHVTDRVDSVLSPTVFSSKSPCPSLQIRERTSVELLSGAEVDGVFQASSGSPMDSGILTGIK